MEPPALPAGPAAPVRAAPGASACLLLPLPKGSPPFTYTWSRAGGGALDERFTSSEDAGGVRLTVSAASTGDTGIYTLQARNAAGSASSQVRLEVRADEAPTGDDPPAFPRRLQDLTVKVGTRTRFLVEIISSTECKVTWYRNERRLLEAERVAFARDGNFWCADVAAVSVDDAGRWTCTAENAGGRASCSAHLNVLVPKAYKRPEFIEELRALLTEQGTVSLECKVVGVPTPVLRWFKDSREIKAGDVFALTANAEDPTSLGTYTCEAVNCMGRAYSSSKVHVVGRAAGEGSPGPSASGMSPEPPPIFTKELEDAHVTICEHLTLGCHIVVPPWPRSVVWYNKEGKVDPGERYHVLEDGVGGYLLEILSAEWADEGEWKCVATSAGGRVGISTCYVAMDVPKNYRKPRFMENLQAVLTEEGLVSFECKVVGFPTPVLSWFKDGQELKPGDVYQLTGTNSLGSYCCIARNCMGQASSSAELTVEDIQNQLNEEEKLQLFSKNQAPKFIQGLKSVEAKIDEPFRFTVKVAIPPEPSVLWYRDDQPVDESARCHLEREDKGVFNMDIQSLEFLDQAEWKCVAMNDFGHSVTSCFLKLIIPRHYKKPRFLENLQAILSEEGAVNLECKVIGVPQPVLKWYKDGEELKPGDIHRIISGQDGTCCLGTYTCEAQNCMGIAASSASLLGFDDSIKIKPKNTEEQPLQRQLSLSTIHEERTSQMYDTPVGDITLDDKGEISFSFDGKEVSVSLYETPDLTEEEALQIVEMYADQLSENVTEHNIVELPPLRFVKETSTSGNLLMEAIIIDVSPDYFAVPDEDLRTEADVEDLSIADENGAPILSLDQDIDLGGEDYLENTIALLSDEKSDFPAKSSRKKSDSQKSGDDFFSLSRDQSLSEEKRDDDTNISESELQSFASARSSAKVKSKSSKPSGEEAQESSEPTKTILFKDNVKLSNENLTKEPENEFEVPIAKPKRERRTSRGSRRSSTSSEKSIGKSREELLRIKSEFEQNPRKKPVKDDEFKHIMNNISTSLTKVINDVQLIERDIILKSELMSSAATSSRSLEIINSLITPLSEIHSIADATKESVSESREVTRTIFSSIPKPLKLLQQSLTIIEKCIDVESDNKTLVKKTCLSFIETCGSEVQRIISDIAAVTGKDYLNTEDNIINEIESMANEINTVIKFSMDTIKTRNLLIEASEIKPEERTLETKHLRDTQKAVFELKIPLNSLIRIVESAESGKITDLATIRNSEVIMNDMSASIQDLQTALEQIESLSVVESSSTLHKYNTEIIESVMDSVLKLRGSFEQLSTETKTDENHIALRRTLATLNENLTEISRKTETIDNKVGQFDVLQSDNKLDVLQKMAQILIALENNLPRLETIPDVKSQMDTFHKNLTKILEKVIESNDAKKYLLMMEICDTINILNTSIKNLDTDNILPLASICNTLKIIRTYFVHNVFESELNCSIMNNISDILVGIHGAINKAEEISSQIDSEYIQDFSTHVIAEAKVNIILEHIDKTIAAVDTIKYIESTQELQSALKPALENICPVLEELRRSVASIQSNGLEQEEHVSEISEISFTQTIASPLCELNQNLIVLNQIIVENLGVFKECNEIITAIAEPLHELHKTLEILQQDVISQYGEDLTPYEVSVNMASVVQNLQSCILMIHEQTGVEAADEMSTLEDISGIKTSIDTLPSDRLVLPTAEETHIEQSLPHFNQEIATTATAHTLQTLNEHIMVLQTPEVIETLDSLSQISDYFSLKTVSVGLGDLHTGIEGILHPVPIEGSIDLEDVTSISKLTAIAEPMQELQQSLSVLDTSNIPIYEHILDLPADKVHSVIQSIADFKSCLEQCMSTVLPAMEVATSTIEISSKVSTLREVCEQLKEIFETSKYAPTQMVMPTEVHNLELVIENLIDATDVSKNIKIDQVKCITEELYMKVKEVQEDIIKFTAQTPENLSQEAKLIQIVCDVETNIAVLEQYDFIDLSRASDITTCTSPQLAFEIDSESLAQIHDIAENVVNVLQDSYQEIPVADLMIVEDFFKTCKNEFTIVRCLITKATTHTKIIRLLQEFNSLQTMINNFTTKRLELHLSDDVNESLTDFLIHADECLRNVRISLIKVVDSQSDLLIDTPVAQLDSIQELKNVINKTDTAFATAVNYLIGATETAKSLTNTLQNEIVKELLNPNETTTPNEEEIALFAKMEEFTKVLDTLISDNTNESSQKVLHKLIECIRKHHDYKDATGKGKTLIIVKCLADCVNIVQDKFADTNILEDEDTEINAKESSLKEVLAEMLQPLQALQTQLVNIREQVLSGADEETIHIDITSTQSIMETMTELHKDIVQQIESEKSTVDNEGISLIMEVDKEIHTIQDSIKSLENIGAAQAVKEITQPMEEIERSLHNVLSLEKDISLKGSQLKETSAELLHNIDQYIELIEIIEEISTIIKFEGVNDTFDIARELKENIAAIESIPPNEQSPEIFINARVEQSKLAKQLQKALSILQVQVLDSAQDLGLMQNTNALQRIAQVTSQLQVNLVAVSGIQTAARAPAPYIKPATSVESTLEFSICTSESVNADTIASNISEQNIARDINVPIEEVLVTNEIPEKVSVISQETEVVPSVVYMQETGSKEKTSIVTTQKAAVADKSRAISMEEIKELSMEITVENPSLSFTGDHAAVATTTKGTPEILKQESCLDHQGKDYVCDTIIADVAEKLDNEKLETLKQQIVKKEAVLTTQGDFIHHINEYVSDDIIKVVNQLSSVMNVEELKQSVHIAKELRECIVAVETDTYEVNDGDLQSLQGHATLVHSLENALSVLSEQTLETLHKLVPSINKDIAEKVITVTQNLKNDIASVFSSQKDILLAPQLPQSNLESTAQLINDQREISNILEEIIRHPTEIAVTTLEDAHTSKVESTSEAEVKQLIITEHTDTLIKEEKQDAQPFKSDEKEVQRAKDASITIETKVTQEMTSVQEIINDTTLTQELNSLELSHTTASTAVKDELNKPVITEQKILLESDMPKSLSIEEEILQTGQQTKAAEETIVVDDGSKIMELEKKSETIATGSIDLYHKIEEQSSMDQLEILLQDVNSKLNPNSNDRLRDSDSEALKDILDEVQTVIMKLKRDYDCAANDTLNETLEDLECSVRSVQLQINEVSPPELLTEACATLQLLVGNMNSQLQISDSILKPQKTEIVLEKCAIDVEETINSLELASKVDTQRSDHMTNIVSKLKIIKDCLKSLRETFLVNADTVIEYGVNILEHLELLEENIFSLDKEIDSAGNLSSEVRDNILTAVHSVYGSISNMRSTVSSIQKRFMFENYGKPSESLLHAIKNIAVISLSESEVEKRELWQKLSKSLRKVLNHFEDIKFYINLDKTARLPSDAAFTKIILEELKNNIISVLYPHAMHTDSNILEKVNKLLDYVEINLTRIESETSLEVKNKIPMFKDIANGMISTTDLIKKQIEAKTETSEIVSDETETIVKQVDDAILPNPLIGTEISLLKEEQSTILELKTDNSVFGIVQEIPVESIAFDIEKQQTEASLQSLENVKLDHAQTIADKISQNTQQVICDEKPTAVSMDDLSAAQKQILQGPVEDKKEINEKQQVKDSEKGECSKTLTQTIKAQDSETITMTIDTEQKQDTQAKYEDTTHLSVENTINESVNPLKLTEETTNTSDYETINKSGEHMKTLEDETNKSENMPSSSQEQVSKMFEKPIETNISDGNKDRCSQMEPKQKESLQKEENALDINIQATHTDYNEQQAEIDICQKEQLNKKEREDPREKHEIKTAGKVDQETAISRTKEETMCLQPVQEVSGKPEIEKTETETNLSQKSEEDFLQKAAVKGKTNIQKEKEEQENVDSKEIERVEIVANLKEIDEKGAYLIDRQVKEELGNIDKKAQNAAEKAKEQDVLMNNTEERAIQQNETETLINKANEAAGKAEEEAEQSEEDKTLNKEKYYTETHAKKETEADEKVKEAADSKEIGEKARLQHETEKQDKFDKKATDAAEKAEQLEKEEKTSSQKEKDKTEAHAKKETQADEKAKEAADSKENEEKVRLQQEKEEHGKYDKKAKEAAEKEELLQKEEKACGQKEKDETKAHAKKETEADEKVIEAADLKENEEKARIQHENEEQDNFNKKAKEGAEKAKQLEKEDKTTSQNEKDNTVAHAKKETQADENAKEAADLKENEEKTRLQHEKEEQDTFDKKAKDAAEKAEQLEKEEKTSSQKGKDETEAHAKKETEADEKAKEAADSKEIEEEVRVQREKEEQGEYDKKAKEAAEKEELLEKEGKACSQKEIDETKAHAKKETEADEKVIEAAHLIENEEKTRKNEEQDKFNKKAKEAATEAEQLEKPEITRSQNEKDKTEAHVKKETVADEIVKEAADLQRNEEMERLQQEIEKQDKFDKKAQKENEAAENAQKADDIKEHQEKKRFQYVKEEQGKFDKTAKETAEKTEKLEKEEKTTSPNKKGNTEAHAKKETEADENAKEAADLKENKENARIQHEKKEQDTFDKKTKEAAEKAQLLEKEEKTSSQKGKDETEAHAKKESEANEKAKEAADSKENEEEVRLQQEIEDQEKIDKKTQKENEAAENAQAATGSKENEEKERLQHKKEEQGEFDKKAKEAAEKAEQLEKEEKTSSQKEKDKTEAHAKKETQADENAKEATDLKENKEKPRLQHEKEEHDTFDKKAKEAAEKAEQLEKEEKTSSQKGKDETEAHAKKESEANEKAKEAADSKENEEEVRLQQVIEDQEKIDKKAKEAAEKVKEAADIKQNKEKARLQHEKEKSDKFDKKAKEAAEKAEQLEKVEKTSCKKEKDETEALAKRESEANEKAKSAADLKDNEEKARLEHEKQKQDEFDKKAQETAEKAKEAADLKQNKKKARLQHEKEEQDKFDKMAKEAGEKAELLEKVEKTSSNKEKDEKEIHVKKESEANKKAENAADLKDNEEKARLQHEKEKQDEFDKKAKEDPEKAKEAAILKENEEKARLQHEKEKQDKFAKKAKEAAEKAEQLEKEQKTSSEMEKDETEAHTKKESEANEKAKNAADSKENAEKAENVPFEKEEPVKFEIKAQDATDKAKEEAVLMNKEERSLQQKGKDILTKKANEAAEKAKEETEQSDYENKILQKENDLKETHAQKENDAAEKPKEATDLREQDKMARFLQEKEEQEKFVIKAKAAAEKAKQEAEQLEKEEKPNHQQEKDETEAHAQKESEAAEKAKEEAEQFGKKKTVCSQKEQYETVAHAKKETEAYEKVKVAADLKNNEEKEEPDKFDKTAKKASEKAKDEAEQLEKEEKANHQKEKDEKEAHVKKKTEAADLKENNDKACYQQEKEEKITLVQKTKDAPEIVKEEELNNKNEKTLHPKEKETQAINEKKHAEKEDTERLETEEKVSLQKEEEQKAKERSEAAEIAQEAADLKENEIKTPLQKEEGEKVELDKNSKKAAERDKKVSEIKKKGGKEFQHKEIEEQTKKENDAAEKAKEVRRQHDKAKEALDKAKLDAEQSEKKEKERIQKEKDKKEAHAKNEIETAKKCKEAEDLKDNYDKERLQKERKEQDKLEKKNKEDAEFKNKEDRALQQKETEVISKKANKTAEKARNKAEQIEKDDKVSLQKEKDAKEALANIKNEEPEIVKKAPAFEENEDKARLQEEKEQDEHYEKAIERTDKKTEQNEERFYLKKEKDSHDDRKINEVFKESKEAKLKDNVNEQDTLSEQRSEPVNKVQEAEQKENINGKKEENTRLCKEKEDKEAFARNSNESAKKSNNEAKPKEEEETAHFQKKKEEKNTLSKKTIGSVQKSDSKDIDGNVNQKEEEQNQEGEKTNEAEKIKEEAEQKLKVKKETEVKKKEEKESRKKEKDKKSELIEKNKKACFEMEIVEKEALVKKQNEAAEKVKNDVEKKEQDQEASIEKKKEEQHLARKENEVAEKAYWEREDIGLKHSHEDESQKKDKAIKGKKVTETDEINILEKNESEFNLKLDEQDVDITKKGKKLPPVQNITLDSKQRDNIANENCIRNCSIDEITAKDRYTDRLDIVERRDNEHHIYKKISALCEKENGDDGHHMNREVSHEQHYIREYQYEPSHALLKLEAKEKPRFVDHNHRDYTMEFARPSSYRERSSYVDQTEKLPLHDYLGRSNTTIYKAQTIDIDSPLRSSASPYPERTPNRVSEHSERREIRHRSKAISEAKSMTTEKRTGTSRDLKRKPVFSTYLTDRTAVEGSRVKLTCSVLSSSDPKVTWYKNGVLLDNKLKYRTKSMDGLITLEVLNAVPSDSAEYSCNIENENGSVNSSANLKVYPSFEASPIPPTFTRSIRDTYHLAENELVLECRIRGQPLPTITWLKDDKSINTNSRYQAYYLADGVCRLAIESPTPEDSGKYTCKAENSVWSDQITHVVNFTGKESRPNPNITTIEKSRFNRQTLESRRPHFTNVLTDYKVVKGGTIGLQVEIRGAPTRVEWLREGCSVTESYRNASTFVEQGLYTLALSDVTEKESGTYTCRAWSAHGNVDMNAAITVVQPNELEGKPAVIVGRPEKDILISVGEDINISFRVQGEPKPKVIFMKGIRDITTSQRVCKMTSDDYVKFTLKRSVITDAGTYCILVRNAYGCDRTFVTVVVRQRASSDNLISDWTYPTDDSTHTVADRKYKSVPERIPGEPRVIEGGNNWISLGWPKSDPGTSAPVLAYKVESWLLGKEGGARWVELGITPLNSFDVFNLKQGEEYHFRITPRNRYGWGEAVQTTSSVGVGIAGERPEFFGFLPGQLKVLVGETATLSCSVKGKPTPEVVWMKNGHEIEDEDGRVSSSFNGSDCSLTLKGIDMDDEARYSCEATNVHGRASTYARLAVVTDRSIWEADVKLKRARSADVEGDFPPQFTMRLRDRRVQATYPVRLTCQAIGSPDPAITWFKDGEEVVPDSRRSHFQDEHFHTLEIAPTTLEDGGVYEAMARNSSGAVSCRCNLLVDKGIRAYVAPEFCCGLEPLYRLADGEELRISAVVEAYPSVGVTWYRDGVRLRPSRRAVMTLDRDGQIELAIAAVTSRDAGVYTCTAANEVGRATTCGKVEVIGDNVTRPPPVFISPDVPYSKEPMFIRKPRSSEAREGDTVIMECEVVGDPKPDVYWLRDFLKPDYYRDSSHFKRLGAGPRYRVEIPHAKLDYTGAYSVVARNAHGEAKAVISLQILARDPSSSEEAHNVRYGRVEVLPHFERELTDLLACDGDAVEFECRVAGHPGPQVRWFHYHELIRECEDFETSFEEGAARLKIKQVTAEDEGAYTCEAANSLGKATCSACLVVYPAGEANTLSQRLRRPPALLSAASTPRSTPRTTPARSVSRTPGPEPRRLCSPARTAAPSFYTYPFNRVAEEGDTTTMQCAVKGNPAPWATWDKDGVIITPSARITIKEKDEVLRVLEIERVTPEDVGVYRITIENESGRAEASARLEVISNEGKFCAGVRAASPGPRRALTYRSRRPSTPRQD